LWASGLLVLAFATNAAAEEATPADVSPTTVSATAPRAPLGTHGETGTAIYSNNDGLRVISPWIQARQQVAGPVSVQIESRTDIITAASVDMISGASPSFQDIRQEVGFLSSYDQGGVGGHAAYTYSTENDTHTHTMTVGGSKELLSRNLTLALAYGLGLDRIGSVREPESLWHDRTSHRADLTVTQVLSPTAIVSAAYTMQQIEGFQSSPYRLVPLVSHDSSQWLRSQAQWVAERHPTSRGRHALTLEARQALGRWLTLRALYRGYIDTWAVRSNTGEVGATFDLGHGWEIGLFERLYWQSNASFYRSMYSVDRAYITRDRRLAAQWSESVNLDVRARFGVVGLLLQGVVLWTRYEDFRTVDADRFVPMAATWAGIVQTALSLDF
jgi:hypothetical protein